MIFKSKIKFAALGGLVLSLLSLLVHLLLAKYSNVDLVQYNALTGFGADFVTKLNTQSARYRKLWGSLKPLETLQPYANSRIEHPVPNEKNNGFIYAKIYGGFEKIRSSICDLVTISRLLNATLVIPEIQDSLNSKGISSKFKSFSYIYNEDQFIAALTRDIIVVKNMPKSLKEARKRNELPIFKLKSSNTPNFYINEVLPKLKQAKAIGVVLVDGGGLQSILPPNMVEYQRLRCRVAFHALHFRPEIQALGHQMVSRLRGGGQPYIAFHPGLKRETLAYHGCAELFQDIHTELIQYRRAQLIKRGLLKEKLSIDSHLRRERGSCPFMPEEVGLLLRAMGYPPKTIIYLSGSEQFGGQRVLTPLRAMYSNLVDRTSLCNKQELSNIISSETPIPENPLETPPSKTKEELEKEWKKAGPRPRPLPPPPDRPIYTHEKEGWYGWITERDTEPDPSLRDLRTQAHRLLWDALDYIVSVEADAFFPGFHNDGSGSPDFSSQIMGHRLYEMASSRTYRPDRKILFGLLNLTREHLYYPGRNWSLLVQEHLNKSLGEEGIIRESRLSKPTSFLAHPLPECSCRTSGYMKAPSPIKDNIGRVLYGGEDECPEWMQHGLATVSLESVKEGSSGDIDTAEEDVELDEQPEFDDKDSGQGQSSSDQDEEMDPND
ncbi:Protein EMBRYO SAC DEVELOPMENT ARREST 30 [Ranunculus cassubicifolius]